MSMPDADYQRIVTDVRRRIADGEWPPGHQLPSRRQMTRMYGVGEGAVRDAITTLRLAGKIEGPARRRLTVSHPVAVRTLSDPDAPWPHRGDSWSSRILAPLDVATRLGLSRGTRVYRERIEMLDADGRPSHLVTTWRASSAHPTWTDSTADVVFRQLSDADGTDLGLIAGLPALVVELVRTAAGRPVEYAEITLPADRWRVRLR
ncbi:GntR family transcriptional regulator [Kitasatospora sp. NPDC004669]|uniref:GntR family transcriptional regulator n=1 Tax=Kitasatospora sp. NPDC004669 TaxID=3154555 RepID=UPI0033BD8456